jgi:hypothetical protein
MGKKKRTSRSVLGMKRYEVVFPIIMVTSLLSAVNIEGLYRYLFSVMGMKVHLIFNGCALILQMVYALSDALEKKSRRGSTVSLIYVGHLLLSTALLTLQYVSGVIAVLNSNYVEVAILVVSVDTGKIRSVIARCERISRGKSEGREDVTRGMLVDMSMGLILLGVAVKILVWEVQGKQVARVYKMCLLEMAKKIGLVVVVDRAISWLDRALMGESAEGEMGVAETGFIGALVAFTVALPGREVLLLLREAVPKHVRLIKEMVARR